MNQNLQLPEIKEFIQAFMGIGATNFNVNNSYFTDRNLVMGIVHSDIFLRLASGLNTDELTLLIKGLCIFESYPYASFGSTTRIPNLLELFGSHRSNSDYSDLINWLFIHRKNPYIPFGRDIPLHVKSMSEFTVYEAKRADHLQKMEKLEQQRHKEARQHREEIRKRHQEVHEQKQKTYQEIQERFMGMTDKQLIDAFNREVKNTGWTSTRATYLSVLREEFKNRDFNYSVIERSKGLSFKKRIKLISGDIVIV